MSKPRKFLSFYEAGQREKKRAALRKRNNESRIGSALNSAKAPKQGGKASKSSRNRALSSRRWPRDVNGAKADAKTEKPRKIVNGLIGALTKAGRGKQAYLTPSEAADYLRISVRTLSKRRQNRDTPSFSRIGQLIRYSRIDLDRFMALTRVQSISDDGGRK
jgi:hypothetical protein